jgi:hypothetical protein
MSTDTGSSHDGQSGSENLDWKSQEILRALYKSDGSANTTEIRTLTGIDSNDKVLYRFREKLAPQELIELEQPESETARPEPKVATFTQQGVEVAERIIDERAGPADLESRVDKLEADFSRVSEQLDAATTQATADDERATEADVDDLQAQLTDLDGNLEALYTNMVRFRDYLNERDNGGYSEYVKQQEEKQQR